MMILIKELEAEYPTAYAEWIADIRERTGGIPSVNNAAVGPATLRLFAGREFEQITHDYFLDRMQQKDGAFLVWPDMERLALVNSFLPVDHPLESILPKQ